MYRGAVVSVKIVKCGYKWEDWKGVLYVCLLDSCIERWTSYGKSSEKVMVTRWNDLW